MLFARVRNYIQRIAKVSSTIIDHMPRNDDNLPTKIIKVISLIDTTQEFLYGKRDPAKEYLSQYNLKRKNNAPFVALFFSSLVVDHFDMTRIAVSNELALLNVTVPGNGKLYFLERKYDNYTERGEDFYHTPDFDFKSFMDNVWSLYDGRIYVTLNNKDYRWKPSFSMFPVSPDPIYGSAKKLLGKIEKKNERCRADGISRSYMFFGPPGSGKSSFAQKLGAKSKKIIKFDAKSIDTITVESINFLLEGLMPDFVIIDDIDKVVWGSSVATLLCILEQIKLEYPKTTIIVTANETRGLDPALYRAGRLDEPIKFDVQDDEDRKNILLSYASKMDVKLSKKQTERIIEKTSGLSAAYLKEVITQLKYSSMEEVLEIIDTMKYLIGVDEEAEEGTPEEPKPDRKKKKSKEKKKNKKRKKR